MRWFSILSTFFWIIFSHSDTNNCSGLQQGQFDMVTDFGTFKIERKDNWQLEKSSEYGILYLHRIELRNECEYILHRYKVLDSGTLPKPDMSEKTITKIIRIKDDSFYFESRILDKNMVLKGKLVKTNDEISDEFIQLIENEIFKDE